MACCFTKYFKIPATRGLNEAIQRLKFQAARNSCLFGRAPDNSLQSSSFLYEKIAKVDYKHLAP